MRKPLDQKNGFMYRGRHTSNCAKNSPIGDNSWQSPSLNKKISQQAQTVGLLFFGRADAGDISADYASGKPHKNL
jgi:hypothetical protein